uniref:HK97 family phage prohead protease n=1 Tax=Paracoccus aminovorans TaxID=34004 RepID=UPI0038CDB9B0
MFIRTLLQLLLYEVSLVSRPAYEASQAELRAMQSAHPVRTQGGGYLPCLQLSHRLAATCRPAPIRYRWRLRRP